VEEDRTRDNSCFGTSGVTPEAYWDYFHVESKKRLEIEQFALIYLQRLVRDQGGPSIGQGEGRDCFQIMPVVNVLKWHRVDGQPSPGKEMKNEKLLKKLKSKDKEEVREYTFTAEEWDEFGIKDVRLDEYVASIESGSSTTNSSYYKPVRMDEYVAKSAAGSPDYQPSEPAGLQHLQWTLMQESGHLMPDIDLTAPSGFECSKMAREIQGAAHCLMAKMGVRGAQMLTVILASHNVGIEEAFKAFCGQTSTSISFQRFQKKLSGLAPSYAAEHLKVASLFMYLCSKPPNDFEKESWKKIRDFNIEKDRWKEVLLRAARNLKNKRMQHLLEGTTLNENGDNITEVIGERKRLRDTFFDDDASQIPNGASARRKGFKLFIKKEQFKTSLARVGVSIFSNPSVCIFA